jgi:hypothetical protein
MPDQIKPCTGGSNADEITRLVAAKARELPQRHTDNLPVRRNEKVGSLRKRRRAEIIAPSCSL